MQFKQNLGKLLKKRDMTMYRLAKELNVHPTTVRNWLDGKTEPKYEMLERIADALGTRVTLLLFNEEDLYYNVDGMSAFKDRIKECRLKLNMSQEDLAENLGLTAEDIKGFEDGTVNVPTEFLHDLANALNTPLEYLFLGEAKVKPDKKLKLLNEIASQLNDKGKDKAIDYVTDLSEQEKYTKPDEPEE